MPVAEALGHRVPAARPTTGTFLPFYSSDGMTLTFATVDQLLGVMNFDLAKGTLDRVRASVQTPIRIELNVAWSVQTPTAAHAIGFELSLVFQVTGAAANSTRCANSPLVWNPTTLKKWETCLFARYFVHQRTENVVATGRNWLNMLTQRGLDTLSLYKQPYLVMFPEKEVRFFVRNGQRFERQTWFANQGCTSCMGAGHWATCTHHIVSAGIKREGVALAVFEILPGQQSPYDLRYGPEMAVAAAVSQLGELVHLHDG